MTPDHDGALWLLSLWGLGGYLLGSVPFGLLVSRAMGLGDVRRIGSGNIGATNVLRTGNRTAALLTLLLDGGKGAAAVLGARWLGGEAAGQAAGFWACIGHCYPLWLRFRGGKAVATTLGTLIAVAPFVGLGACAAWAATAAAFRVSSLAALVAVGAAPALALLMGRADATLLCLLLAALVLWRHRGNVARLLAGTEPRIGQGRAGR